MGWRCLVTKQVALFFFSFKTLNSTFDEGVLLFVAKKYEKPKIPHSLKYRIRTHKSTSKTTPQKKIKVAAVELPEMSIQILSSKKRRNNVKRQLY